MKERRLVLMPFARHNGAPPPAVTCSSLSHATLTRARVLGGYELGGSNNKKPHENENDDENKAKPMIASLMQMERMRRS